MTSLVFYTPGKRWADDSAWNAEEKRFATASDDPAKVVGFYSHKPLADYPPGTLIVTEEAASKLAQEACKAHYCKGFEKITKERFWEMLEILPPCKWQKYQGVELFHMSERCFGNFAEWFFEVGDDHYSYVAEDNLPAAELVKRLKEYLNV